MSSPFHVYLDLEIRNEDTASTSAPSPLSFEETRLQPFLVGDASDYFCTIARFELQTSNSIPVFIPEIESVFLGGGGNPVYNTIYKVAFQHSDTKQTYGPLNVVFTPSDRTITGPGVLSTNIDPSSTFFHMHSYQRFTDMINTTLISLFNNIVAVGGGRYNPPYLEWNNETYTATLHVDNYYFDTTPSNTFLGSAGFGTDTGKWEIYFNTRLFQLFNTFPATFMNASGDLNYRLDVFGTAGNTTELPVVDSSGNPIYNISMTQEISTISNMSPLDPIVFTSTSLPILPQLSSMPKIITSTGKDTIGSGLPNITNVLTDFQIALSASNHYKPSISYTPPGEYRLIDMYSNNDLRRIDLQVFWKDKKGMMHPLLLYPGCAASVKFLFRHKHFYLGV